MRASELEASDRLGEKKMREKAEDPKKIVHETPLYFYLFYIFIYLYFYLLIFYLLIFLLKKKRFFFFPSSFVYVQSTSWGYYYCIRLSLSIAMSICSPLFCLPV